jgi:hypothetical protein
MPPGGAPRTDPLPSWADDVLLRHRRAQRGDGPGPVAAADPAPGPDAARAVTTAVTLGELLYGAGRRGSAKLERASIALSRDLTVVTGDHPAALALVSEAAQLTADRAGGGRFLGQGRCLLQLGRPEGEQVLRSPASTSPPSAPAPR